MNLENVCLVMDNCHCHRDEDVYDICSILIPLTFGGVKKRFSREIILDSAFIVSLVQITPEMLNNTYEHMRKYVYMALEGQDI